MKNLFILITVISVIAFSCKQENSNPVLPIELPDSITIEGVAQNPEGIEYNKNDSTFLLSSLNAAPIIKVKLDGTYIPFTSGEPFPLSTAGIQIDYNNNRFLATGFNGLEAFDNDTATKGVSHLRIYNLETGVLEQDINLSSLVPDASVYFANDLAVDNVGNVYISDWFAGVIYKVDLLGNPSLFWSNDTGIPAEPNGLDFHPSGYLLVSLVAVNNEGLYSEYGLVKIPVNDPSLATNVNISDSDFTGFDGMVINAEGSVIGVTNNGISAGGNTLIKLSSNDNWESAEVVNSKGITPSTTVAITQDNKHYVINQDFSNDTAETWTIEQIKF